MVPAGMHSRAIRARRDGLHPSAHEPEIEPVPGALNRSMLAQRVHAGPWWLTSGSEPAWSSVDHHGASTGPWWLTSGSEPAWSSVDHHGASVVRLMGPEGWVPARSASKPDAPVSASRRRPSLHARARRARRHERANLPCRRNRPKPTDTGPPEIGPKRPRGRGAASSRLETLPGAPSGNS
jgi:hypothetical protein